MPIVEVGRHRDHRAIDRLLQLGLSVRLQRLQQESRQLDRREFATVQRARPVGAHVAFELPDAALGTEDLKLTSGSTDEYLPLRIDPHDRRCEHIAEPIFNEPRAGLMNLPECGETGLLQK